MASLGEEGEISLYSILVVDDDVAILKDVERMLKNTKRFDCVVSTASDPEEAKDLLARGIYDLIIADHKMPDMTGTELLAQAKKRYPSTLRVLVTGYPDLETAKKAINEANVHSFVEKPWANQRFLRMIEEKLKSHLENGREKEIFKPRDVREAVSIVEDIVESEVEDIDRVYRGVQTIGKTGDGEKKILRLKFLSVTDFNKFPYELKHLDIDDVEIGIEDFRIHSDSYTVTISLTIEK